MKCPNCGTNHPKNEGPACRCGYRFVFNPQNDQGMTDGKFNALVKAAGRDGTYYFTKNQLYAAYCRRVVRGGRFGRILMLLVMGVILAFWLLQLIQVIHFGDDANVGAGVLLIVLLITYLTRRNRAKALISRGQFEAMIERWLSAGQPLEKLLTKPRLHEPPPDWPESDIYDYGVEKILIVEHDLMVDELVLNAFHSQEKTLVISQNGYPEYLGPRLHEILEKSPDIPVYYLHDAAPGESPPAGLRKASELAGGREVVDLGLSEADVKKIPGLKAPSSGVWPGRIPVDAMLFAGLAGLLAASLMEGAAIGQVLAMGQGPGSDGGMTYG